MAGEECYLSCRERRHRCSRRKRAMNVIDYNLQVEIAACCHYQLGTRSQFPSSDLAVSSLCNRHIWLFILLVPEFEVTIPPNGSWSATGLVRLQTELARSWTEWAGDYWPDWHGRRRIITGVDPMEWPSHWFGLRTATICNIQPNLQKFSTSR